MKSRQKETKREQNGEKDVGSRILSANAVIRPANAEAKRAKVRERGDSRAIAKNRCNMSRDRGDTSANAEHPRGRLPRTRTTLCERGEENVPGAGTFQEIHILRKILTKSWN